MRRHIRAGAVLAVMLVAAGCKGVHADYVEADRATFDAVTPEYLGYVDADAGLAPAQKARRARTIATWDLRLKKAEASK